LANKKGKQKQKTKASLWKIIESRECHDSVTDVNAIDSIICFLYKNNVSVLDEYSNPNPRKNNEKKEIFTKLVSNV